MMLAPGGQRWWCAWQESNLRPSDCSRAANAVTQKRAHGSLDRRVEKLTDIVLRPNARKPVQFTAAIAARDAFEEAQEVGAGVARRTLAQHAPAADLQRGVQAREAIAL